MNLGISGKRVLVTGASQGVGEACARAFAAEGCRVAIVARRPGALARVLQAMGGAAEGHAQHAADLMAAGAPDAVLDALDAAGDPFEVVIHNLGGTLDLKDPLAPAEDWQRVWRYNAGIAIDLNARLVPPMQARGWGRIVHISSISAEALRGAAAYGAAKAYLNAYTKTLGRALAPEGIVVSALMPGALYAPGGPWDRNRRERPHVEPDFLRHHQAVGRLGTPEEIAPFALFMASQHVTFAQGAILPVDGGTM